MRQRVKTLPSLSHDPERLYLLRMGLRVFVIALITLFIGHQYFVFAAAIGVATFVLYAASAVFRRHNEVSDALLTLGDLPALIGLVHLPAHAPVFEAVIPVWLIGSTVANLRKGRPALLPFYSLAAWLVLISHATSTDDPLGYAVVQTLAVGVASAVAVSVVLERQGHRTDSLTGTLTRRAGLEELTQLSKQGGNLTLAFVDLRHFKAQRRTWPRGRRRGAERRVGATSARAAPWRRAVSLRQRRVHRREPCPRPRGAVA